MTREATEKKSKLGEVINSLDTKEVNDLKHFVYLNGNGLNKDHKAALLEMLNTISSRKKVEEKKIFDSFFNENEQKISKAKTHILKVVFRFLKFKAFDEDELMGDYFLLKSLKQRKCKKNFEYKLFKFDEKNNTETYSNTDFKQLTNVFLADFKLKFTEATRVNDSLYFIANLIKKLKDFYVEKHLYFAVEEINRDRIINKQPYAYKQSEYKYLLEHKTTEKEILALQYILILLTSIKNKQENNFNEANNFVLNNYNLFSEDYGNDFLITLVNFCYQKLNEGKYEYAQYVWKNYKFRINLSVINKTPVNPIFYLNVVLFGLNIKSLKDVEEDLKILKQNIDKSNLDTTAAALTLAKAAIAYSRKTKPIRSNLADLIDFTIKDWQLQLQHDILKTKMLYDIEDFENITEMKKYNIKEYKVKKIRAHNFFKAIENLIINKPIKDLHKKNYFHSDYLWLTERQNKQ